MNRVLPDGVKDGFFREWRAAQERFLKEIESYFEPVPVRRVALFPHEVVGYDRIKALARSLMRS